MSETLPNATPALRGVSVSSSDPLIRHDTPSSAYIAMRGVTTNGQTSDEGGSEDTPIPNCIARRGVTEPADGDSFTNPPSVEQRGKDDTPTLGVEGVSRPGHTLGHQSLTNGHGLDQSLTGDTPTLGVEGVTRPGHALGQQSLTNGHGLDQSLIDVTPTLGFDTSVHGSCTNGVDLEQSLTYNPPSLDHRGIKAAVKSTKCSAAEKMTNGGGIVRENGTATPTARHFPKMSQNGSKNSSLTNGQQPGPEDRNGTPSLDTPKIGGLASPSDYEDTGARPKVTPVSTVEEHAEDLAAPTFAEGVNASPGREEERTLHQPAVVRTNGARPKVRKHTYHRSNAPPVDPDSSDSEAVTTQESQTSRNTIMSSEGEADNADESSYIYTYKGNFKGRNEEFWIADLPKSFYNFVDIGSDSEGGGGSSQLGVSGAGQSNLSTEVAALIQSEMASHPQNVQALPVLPNGQQQHNVSPEMDFLEMDFADSDLDSNDSGQGGDENVTETNEDDSEVEQATNPLPMLSEVVLPKKQPHVPESLPLALSRPGSSENQHQSSKRSMEEQPAGMISAPLVTPVREDLSFMVRSRSLNSPFSSHSNNNNNNSNCLLNTSDHPNQRRLANAASPFDPVNMEICVERLFQKEKLVFGVNNSTQDWSKSSITEKTMIWNEIEACHRQLGQSNMDLESSSNAISNALAALDIEHSVTKLRYEIAVPLPNTSYDTDLIEMLIDQATKPIHQDNFPSYFEKYSDGKVVSRFFHMYPSPTKVNILLWLQNWIKKGAIPIATINNQKDRHGSSTSQWNHHMIFGVGPGGAYLANPIRLIDEETFLQVLCSPSVLLIPKESILDHWNLCDLSRLQDMEDLAWDDLNVLGQVVHVLREGEKPFCKQANLTYPRNVRIPTKIKSGITLAMLKSNPYIEELLSAPEIQNTEVTSDD